jgi:predicted metalloprotease with PDZ domain
MSVELRRHRATAAGWVLACGLMCLAESATAATPAAAPNADAKVYELVYGATLDPVTRRAQVRIALRQSGQLVRHIDFVAPSDRYFDAHGQGTVETTSDRIVWTPPADGGVLHYEFVIDHRRPDGGQDARITDSWALLKLDHLFPRAMARVVKGARSNARLRVQAPTGWAIETPYGPAAGHMVDVDDPDRHFDRPRGWLLAGKLDVRRDKFDERRVAVASPVGSGFRANDVLAFVRWMYPSLLEVFPDFPQRLLIVSAPDGMWRGGLSGANSLYMNIDRPLVSGNGTSTLVHELMHVASGLHATGGADWIVEGMAEYYSIELLRRSGTISASRYERAFAKLAQWSAGQKCVATDRSEGPITARAVLVMRALDTEIRAATRGTASLDAVTQKLIDANEPVTNAAFRADAAALIGGPAAALADCP